MKNKKIFKSIIFIAIFLLLIGGAFTYALYSNGMLKINESSSNSDIKLNYTNTTTNSNTGIYITDVSDIVSNTMPSIVSITSKVLIQSGKYGPSFFGYGEDQYSTGAGSGIIIGQNDDEILILTNNHVVEDSSELTVKFINDKEVDASIKGTSSRKDVAVISVKVSNLNEETLKEIKIATLGDSNELKVGNGIIAIGNALGYGQSVTTGVVSALNREVAGESSNNKMIQIDAAINGGNSGGALLNSKGEVVGINSAKYSSSGSSSSASIEGMGFAIPISDVLELINDLKNGNNDAGGMLLGIEGYMTNSSYNMPSGFYVSKITEGGNADKSELEIGNIIVEVDGNKVNSVDDISDALYIKKVGDSIKLKVKYVSGREYKEKEINVSLN